MTDRQAGILSAIVEAYAEVGHPIGSVTLAKLFKVASSTIRGEMNTLEKKGYIKQPYTSAGRIPTEKGYRWYVNYLHTQDNVQDKIDDQWKAIGVRIQNAGEPEQAIKSAVESLSELTLHAGMGSLGSHLYTYGLGSLFSQPEFTSKETIQALAYLLDNLEVWFQEIRVPKSVGVFIGKENPIGKASGCSLIISQFRSPYSDCSYLGVIGPMRQDYKQSMNLVKYTADVLEKSLEERI